MKRVKSGLLVFVNTDQECDFLPCGGLLSEQEAHNRGGENDEQRDRKPGARRDHRRASEMAMCLRPHKPRVSSYGNHLFCREANKIPLSPIWKPECGAVPNRQLRRNTMV